MVALNGAVLYSDEQIIFYLVNRICNKILKKIRHKI